MGWRYYQSYIHSVSLCILLSSNCALGHELELDWCNSADVPRHERQLLLRGIDVLPALTGHVEDAKGRLSLLGRSGIMPWERPEVAHLLPYVDIGDLVLAPPAHGGLRGPLRTLFSLALKSTEASLSKQNISAKESPVLFSSVQRKFVQVSRQRALMLLDILSYCYSLLQSGYIYMRLGRLSMYKDRSAANALIDMYGISPCTN